MQKRRSIHPIILSFLAIPALTLLASCGGGGGGMTGGSSPGVSAGVITGKGSVIVNGVEFETPNDPARIIIDDVPGHLEDELKIGMFVKIKGTFDSDTHGRAAEIESDPAVKGVATVIGDALSVMGQTVIVTPMTKFEDTAASASDLAPLDGAVVEVHGLFSAPNTIRATLIEQEDPEDREAELRGVIEELSRDGDSGSFFIGTQEVRFGRFATRFEDVSFDTLSDGDFVEVEGEVTDGILVAEKIEKEEPFGEMEPGELFEGEGIAEDVDPGNRTFTLSGPAGPIEVRWDGDTKFEDGQESDLRNGVFVEVEGVLLDGGILLAREIEFEDEEEMENLVRMEANLEEVDPDGRTVTALGLSVDVSGAMLEDVESLEALAAIPNAHVEIRGNPDGAGGVVASRLKLLDPDDRTFLRGPVESHDPGGPDLTILGITIRTTGMTEFENAADNPISAAAFFGLLTDGVTIVKARGDFDPATATIFAEEVEIE